MSVLKLEVIIFLGLFIGIVMFMTKSRITLFIGNKNTNMQFTIGQDDSKEAR